MGKSKRANRDFNSQPHKEADSHRGTDRRACHISTHSLTRRLTTNKVESVKQGWYFNSQPHKEADTRSRMQSTVRQNFNSQPHKEADQGQRVALVCGDNFNSQPHKEADTQGSRIRGADR